MSLLESIKLAVTAALGRVGLDGRSAAFLAVTFLVTTFGSIALTGAVLVRLPPDYLLDAPPSSRRPKPAREIAYRALRYLAGTVLILIGLVLSLPGVPGQGLLTIIAGILVAGFPGTRRLLRRICRRPRVLSALNALRVRYKHPPLAPPDDSIRPPGEA